MDAKTARTKLVAGLQQAGLPAYLAPGVVQGLQAWALVMSNYGEVVSSGTPLNSHNWGLIPCFPEAIACILDDRSGAQIAVWGSDGDGITAWVSAIESRPGLKAALMSGQTYMLSRVLGEEVFGGLTGIQSVTLGQALEKATQMLSYELGEPLMWMGLPGPRDDAYALELLQDSSSSALANALKTPTGLQGILAWAIGAAAYGNINGLPTNNWGRIGPLRVDDVCPPDTIIDERGVQCINVYGTPQEGIIALLNKILASGPLITAVTSGDTGLLAYEMLQSGVYGPGNPVTQGEWMSLALVLQAACDRLASQPLGLGGFRLTTDVPAGLVPTAGATAASGAPIVIVGEGGPPLMDTAPEAETKTAGPSLLKLVGIVGGMFAIGYGVTWAADKSGLVSVEAR